MRLRGKSLLWLISLYARHAHGVIRGPYFTFQYLVSTNHPGVGQSYSTCGYIFSQDNGKTMASLAVATGTEDGSNIPEEELPENNTGYVAPKKVTVGEILEKDQDDESLKRYKESLLGSTAIATDPNSKHVEIFELRVKVPGMDDIILPLRTEEDRLKAKNSPYRLVGGSAYRLEIVFRVQKDVVSGLKYMQFVYEHGFRVDRDEVMIGSYAPKNDVYTFMLPMQTVPTGLLAYGTYKAKTRFLDDDGTNHLTFEYSFKIVKE